MMDKGWAMIGVLLAICFGIGLSTRIIGDDITDLANQISATQNELSAIHNEMGARHE